MEPSESLREEAEEAIKKGLPGFSYGGHYHIGRALQKGQVSAFFVLDEYVVYVLKDPPSE